MIHGRVLRRLPDASAIENRRRVRRLSRSLVIGVVLTLVSCATPESRFAAQEEQYRQELRSLYRPGSQWREPGNKLGSFELWQLAAPAPDGFAELALAHARAQSDDLRGCWLGFVARETLGSSFGAVGAFRDYVFVDSHDRVVVAYRRFID